jgi:hypothetical protein
MGYDFWSRYTLLRSCTFAFGNTQFLLEIFLFQLHFLRLFFLLDPFSGTEGNEGNEEATESWRDRIIY